MSAQFVAWLVGVDADDVKAYRDVADWPSHWAGKAQHRMRSLGITSEAEAFQVFRTQHFYD